MKSTHFDVIVIGAGMAGLVCAARLAKAGKKVLLLEQHNIVGGYCTNFKRKGYEFDASIHLILGCEPGGLLHNILLDCGAENYVGFIKLDPTMYKAVFPDRTLLIPSTIKTYKDMLYKEFPHEKKGINSIFDGMERIYDLLMLLNDNSTSNLSKLLAPIRNPVDMAYFLRHANMSFGDFLDRHTGDRRLREVVSQLWAFLGVPPEKLSMLFFTMMFMGYLKEGTFYIKGGAQSLSNALAKACKENSGTIITSADVKKIHISKNKAKGVDVYLKRKKTTETFTADNIVSCADPTHTICDLIDPRHLPGFWKYEFS